MSCLAVRGMSVCDSVESQTLSGKRLAEKPCNLGEFAIASRDGHRLASTGSYHLVRGHHEPKPIDLVPARGQRPEG